MADRSPRRSVTERLPRKPVHLRLVTPRADGAPVTRADCVNGPRPCLWIGCTQNLWLDVTHAGSVVFNFPDVDPWEMAESCALDVAARGGVTLETAGELLNVTRARAEQIENVALGKLASAAARRLLGEVR